MSTRRILLGSTLGLVLAAAVIVVLELRLREEDELPDPAHASEWEAWRDVVHRPTSVPGLPWELAPELDLDLFGWGLQSNTLGMRDDEPETERDVFRVAAIGGAFTFGWGTRRDELWTTLFERSLDRSMLVSGRAADVLDLGVAGYGAREAGAVLEHRALSLDPWVVVLEVDFADGGDAPLRLLQRRFVDSESWSGSRLLGLLRGHERRSEVDEKGGHQARLYAEDGAPWQEVVESFARVSTLCAPRAVPVVLMLVPETGSGPWSAYPHRARHAQVAEQGRRNNFAVLDLLEVFEREAPESLVLSHQDPRPNARAQALAAESVKRFLYTSGVLTLVLEAH